MSGWLHVLPLASERNEVFDPPRRRLMTLSLQLPRAHHLRPPAAQPLLQTPGVIGHLHNDLTFLSLHLNFTARPIAFLFCSLISLAFQQFFPTP